jgi:L-asparaginase/Glu-tRNA(Gln) amidotransferase subunit D
VNVTQCSKGMVECNYATGRALVECGVISGHDLTTECALAKLAYAIMMYATVQLTSPSVSYLVVIYHLQR